MKEKNLFSYSDRQTVTFRPLHISPYLYMQIQILEAV